MKKTILVLITLAWVAFWWRWYTCKICTTCGCHQKEIPAAPLIQPESGVLLFNQKDSVVVLRDGWLQFKDSILTTLSPGQQIEIEGHYLGSEPNTSIFENMGIARANAIKQLFPDSLQSKIKLKSLLIAERPGMDKFPFIASAFSVNTVTDKIEQEGNKTNVYFPYNSDQRIKDPEIEAYLSSLAAQHKATRSSFTITGHTDNVGDEQANETLGKSRAETIKKYLMSKGISSDRIVIKSMGESNPIADNATPQGRQKNRRIEIELIQKQ